MSHSQFDPHHPTYQDDDLMLEEEGLCSGCGFEDFVDLIESWQEFTQSR